MAVKWIDNLQSKMYHVVGDDAVFDCLGDAITMTIVAMILNKAPITDAFLKKYEVYVLSALKNIAKNTKQGIYKKDDLLYSAEIKQRMKKLK